ncbi:hypothetical protein ACFX13_010419 [Malus domestica]|uniref:pectinesterase n=1 Tax=Malus domestica TaxID=3750 RepID=A0A498IF01_MALDO|nr:probable pectinesterase 55 [Malus domestica]RXH82158.1 hypothetical protein DVH24_036499 [Malus domestica]
MQFLIISSTLALFFLLGAVDLRYVPGIYNLQDNVISTIIVDPNGLGNFTSVQQAIDSVAPNNTAWTRIHINYGIYTEKVQIAVDKPYIYIEGDSDRQPVIQYADGGSILTSPTFKARADNFVARNIIFKNTYDNIGTDLLDANGKRKTTTWAVALDVSGDKASFYHCSFSSLQDTLSDAKGRHYFYDCTIEGLIDFIWGHGQSIYEKCTLISRTDVIGGTAYITANGRGGADDPSGFVFKDCHITGSGPANLGRAYGTHSRVLFYRTDMDNIITPQGWGNPWNAGHEGTIEFAEVECKGDGANREHRINWEKNQTAQEVRILTDTASFINQDGWLEKHPN